MTRNDVPRKGTLTLLAAILAACAGSGTADTSEPTTSSGSETTVGPGAPQLLYDGAPVTADNEACAGADGAVVFRSDDDSTMVGFEDGIFLRYIAPDGTATDTADVTVTEDDTGTPYEDDLPIGGGPVTVTIVLPTDMIDLPEWTF